MGGGKEGPIVGGAGLLLLLLEPRGGGTEAPAVGGAGLLLLLLEPMGGGKEGPAVGGTGLLLLLPLVCRGRGKRHRGGLVVGLGGKRLLAVRCPPCLLLNEVLLLITAHQYVAGAGMYEIYSKKKTHNFQKKQGCTRPVGQHRAKSLRCNICNCDGTASDRCRPAPCFRKKSHSGETLMPA